MILHSKDAVGNYGTEAWPVLESLLCEVHILKIYFYDTYEAFYGVT